MAGRRIVLQIELVFLGLITVVLAASKLFAVFNCEHAVCIYLAGSGEPISLCLAGLAWPIGVFGIGWGTKFRDRMSLIVSLGIAALPVVFFVALTLIRSVFGGG